MKNVKNSLRIKHVPQRIRLSRVVPTPAQAAAWLALACFAFVTGAALIGRDRFVMHDDAQIYAAADPTSLSAEDRGLYILIDQAQAAGDYSKADSMIDKLANRGLLGYVLAERYLSGRYAARAEELSAWLKHFADLPQAPSVARIAALRGVKINLPKPVEPLKGSGSGDHLGRSAMPDRWYTAMRLWREGEISQAAATFHALGKNESLNDWQRSAALFWSARAEERMGNSSEARAYLKQAADFDTTFYGMLAAEQLGNGLPAAEAPEVSDSLRHNPRAIRASLLAQMDRKDDAEIELRNLYGAVGEAKRKGIVTLAGELNMPNLQMRLARAPGLSKSEALYAKFPMPHYMVALDSVMDSALLMAVARNESAFHEGARNPYSGATGMMQMLPSTARVVERRVGETLLSEASASEPAGDVITRLNNPALSARYGAEYLRMIAKEPAINNSLIYLLIGYNAGPGTAANWKAASHSIEDPLVFIESIPYAETRNYVMQVLAQYWIYQSSMDAEPASLKDLGDGKWPSLRESNG